MLFVVHCGGSYLGQIEVIVHGKQFRAFVSFVVEPIDIKLCVFEHLGLSVQAILECIACKVVYLKTYFSGTLTIQTATYHNKLIKDVLWKPLI